MMNHLKNTVRVLTAVTIGLFSPMALAASFHSSFTDIVEAIAFLAVILFGVVLICKEFMSKD